jgi:hypothetical protein
LVIALKLQCDRFLVDRTFPRAEQPIEIVEAVLSGAPLARRRNSPLAVVAHMKDAVLRRTRQILAAPGLTQDSFLNGAIARWKADRLDVNFDFAWWLGLKKVGIGGLDRSPPTEDLAAVVVEFAVLRPQGGDGFGVPFFKRRREIARRFFDGVAVLIGRRRWRVWTRCFPGRQPADGARGTQYAGER